MDIRRVPFPPLCPMVMIGQVVCAAWWHSNVNARLSIDTAKWAWGIGASEANMVSKQVFKNTYVGQVEGMKEACYHVESQLEMLQIRNHWTEKVPCGNSHNHNKCITSTLKTPLKQNKTLTTINEKLYSNTHLYRTFRQFLRLFSLQQPSRSGGFKFYPLFVQLQNRIADTTTLWSGPCEAASPKGEGMRNGCGIWTKGPPYLLKRKLWALKSWITYINRKRIMTAGILRELWHVYISGPKEHSLAMF